jgi:hypothetical protein
MTEVFISMKPMSKRLVVRITDSQAKWLAIALSQENTTKSRIIRNAINSYLVEKTRLNEDLENKKIKRYTL